MGHKQEVQVKTRDRAAAVAGKQSFQAEIVPNAVWEGKRLYARLGALNGFSAERARMAVLLIEGFVREELSKGNRVDFDLVSFYPRLSGALSARDADPEDEGVFARGAVKARRELSGLLRRKLDPVNALSNVRPRLYGMTDTELGQDGVIVAGHVLRLVGRDVPIDATRPDEGIWLEKRMRGNVATAEVLESQPQAAKFVFRETPPIGKYTLVVGTRCGKGTDFRVRRCLLDVRVV